MPEKSFGSVGNWVVYVVNAVPRTVSAVSLAVAVFFYVLVLVFYASIGAPDKMGLGPWAAGTSTSILWIAVAAYVLSTAFDYRLKAPTFLSLLVVIAVSAIVSVWYVSLATRSEWILLSPIVLPPLVVGFAFGLRWVRGAEGRSRFGFVIGIVATLLWIPAVVGAQREEVKRAADARKLEAWAQRMEAEAAAEFERRLKPSSHLADLLPYLEHDLYYIERGWSKRALAAIQRLPSRQSDAVELIEEGMPLEELIGLHQYNLKAKPELCSGYRSALIRLIDEPAVPDLAWQLEQQFPNIKWLSRNGCDLSQAAERPSRLRAAGSTPNEREVAQSLEEIAGTFSSKSS